MEVLLSAVASDLVGWLVSFLVSKFHHHEPADSGTDDDVVVRLQRALLRAEAREVTNRAMLQQLGQLREEICRAAYVLDASISTRRAAAVDPGRRSHAAPAGPSRWRPRWAACRNWSSSSAPAPASAGGRTARQRLPLRREMEKEHIVGFLLLRPAAPDQLDVLPVVGPHDVGKRTLVEHACLDERVRRHFAKVVHLSSYDLGDLQGCLVNDTAARSLFAVDLAGGAAVEKVPHRPVWKTGYYYPLVPVKDAPTPSAPCLFYNRRKWTGAVARSEIPEVTMLDIVRGVVPGRRGEASRIPPHGSYVATCHMDGQRCSGGGGRQETTSE
ncbi:hypothetical protein U9M48_020306 [Paspalum notatum var. saurae]|uniref:Rx N-terminal domain-containing protein n=1 Tax=Paspalum notatum var. saurae TaxID=547442 RepID=A0AAQ3TES9_PASNO